MLRKEGPFRPEKSDVLQLHYMAAGFQPLPPSRMPIPEILLLRKIQKLLGLFSIRSSPLPNQGLAAQVMHFRARRKPVMEQFSGWWSPPCLSKYPVPSLFKWIRGDIIARFVRISSMYSFSFIRFLMSHARLHTLHIQLNTFPLSQGIFIHSLST